MVTFDLSGFIAQLRICFFCYSSYKKKTEQLLQHCRNPYMELLLSHCQWRGLFSRPVVCGLHDSPHHLEGVCKNEKLRKAGLLSILLDCLCVVLHYHVKPFEVTIGETAVNLPFCL